MNATLTGDASLSQRPMERVAKPLRLLGADIATADGRAPVTVRAAKLTGREVDTAAASAQVKSALLLAALGAEGETFVHESVKTRDHTERMLAAMGADIRVLGNTVRVKKSALRAVDIEVPGGAFWPLSISWACNTLWKIRGRSAENRWRISASKNPISKGSA